MNFLNVLLVPNLECIQVEIAISDIKVNYFVGLYILRNCTDVNVKVLDNPLKMDPIAGT